MNMKAIFSARRILDFSDRHEGNVVIGFSGGKDSRVVMDIVRSVLPSTKAVFSDTGLEYPEIREFVREFDNVDWVKPQKSFKQVITEYGFPLVSKKTAKALRMLQNPTDKNANLRNLYLTGKTRDGRDAPSYKLAKRWYPLIDAPFKISDQCCEWLKEKPLDTYKKEHGVAIITGLMAADSDRRENAYLTNGGCNTYGKNSMCWALGIWNEEDVWSYIRTKNLSYCPIYDKGERRTGCIFCGFGLMFETPENNRFTRLKELHPKLYEYCMEELGVREILEIFWKCMKK